MASQDMISLGGYDAVQPDKFEFKFSTTMSNSSGRPQSGVAQLSPLFTVESYDIEFSELTPAQASEILQIIVPKRRSPYFEMKYFSPYYAKWRTDSFYVGDGSVSVRTLKKSEERMQTVSFTVVGRNPIA